MLPAAPVTGVTMRINRHTGQAYRPRMKISQPSRCGRMTAGTARSRTATVPRVRSWSTARLGGSPAVSVRIPARPGRAGLGQAAEGARQAQRR